MPCLACARRPGKAGGLCAACRADLLPGSERRLPDGVLVRSAFVHRGAARLLVHRLKYGGHHAAAAVLAGAMAGRLPPGAGALVPVPRARLRRWRYGVDPAVELARALGRVCSLPVVTALAPEWWHRRRAGLAGARRGLPRFRLVRGVPAGAVLVDDVVTTGATLRAAAAALGGPCAAVTATTALGTRALPPGPPRGYSEAKPPPGDADYGGVRAATRAPPPGSHSFPA
jgi:predicted amidophosphoribosyltransferase